jgi:capsular polysaccharide biosynthesis protein
MSNKNTVELCPSLKKKTSMIVILDICFKIVKIMNSLLVLIPRIFDAITKYWHYFF